MKKLVVWVMLLGVITVLGAGCASPYPQGMLYTKLKLPVAVTGNKLIAPKVGVAQCVSYCGMVTFGDASLKTAMKNGAISRIHYVDWEVESVMAGIIGKYKLVVYGE